MPPVRSRRQLRLRDMGIIICDFIDMESKQNRERVFQELRSHLTRDRARTKAFAISELGLVEMTRQRVRPSLYHSQTQLCPTCHGTGRIFTPESVLRRIERALHRVADEGNERALVVRVHPEVALLSARAGAAAASAAGEGTGASAHPARRPAGASGRVPFDGRRNPPGHDGAVRRGLTEVPKTFILLVCLYPRQGKIPSCTPSSGRAASSSVQSPARRFAFHRSTSNLGQSITFEEVLLAGGDEIKVGAPLLSGAAVTAEVVKHGKGEKIIIFKHKRRKNYRRKQGHRQKFTEVRVGEINLGIRHHGT